MRISKMNVLLCLADRKMTMKQLAEKIRMKPQNISNILSRGTCLPVTAARIADGLGVTVAEIIEEG